MEQIQPHKRKKDEEDHIEEKHKKMKTINYIGRQRDPIAEMIKVLHKTDDILVIDKPYDVHIDGKQNVTIEKLVNEQFPEMLKSRDNQERRKLKFAHQLDYATSGILCLAFTRKSCASIATCFQDRRAQKVYLAVCFGHINGDKLINAAITEDETDLSGFRMRIAENGKESETALHVISRGKYTIDKSNIRPITKVLLKPKTGRRHQLRLHTRHIGHPIVGDATYADDIDSPRMMLHAFRLTLPLKDKKLELEAPDPFGSVEYFEFEK